MSASKHENESDKPADETKRQAMSIADKKTVADATKRQAMSIADKKTVADARHYARQHENEMAEIQRHFSKKGSFGLWWDCNRFFKSSDRNAVVAFFEGHREFYEKMVDLATMIEKGDEHSYETLIHVYEELDRLERDAESEVKRNTSKTICSTLKEFLSTKFVLDHKLKRVECVVLRQTVDRIEENSQENTKRLEKMTEQLEGVRLENEDLRTMVKQSFRKSEEANAKMLEKMDNLLASVINLVNERADGGNRGSADGGNRESADGGNRESADNKSGKSDE